MRIEKRVALTGEASFAPIELPDLVVGMNHLGWSPLSHERFVLHKRSLLWWLLYIFGGWIVRLQMRNNRNVQRLLEGGHWLEAKLDASGAQRALAVRGRASLRERRNIDALLEALGRGERWLSPQGPG